MFARKFHKEAGSGFWMFSEISTEEFCTESYKVLVYDPLIALTLRLDLRCDSQ